VPRAPVAHPNIFATMKMLQTIPRQTEETYHCINFNDRVRKVPKIKIYIFGTFLTLSLKLKNKNMRKPVTAGVLSISLVKGSFTLSQHFKKSQLSLPSAVGPYTKNLAINV
jgi:hypothetical protein